MVLLETVNWKVYENHRIQINQENSVRNEKSTFFTCLVVTSGLHQGPSSEFCSFCHKTDPTGVPCTIA